VSNKFTQIALLVTIASVLFTLESFIPSPIPWIRLGLANGITLIALTWWGMKEGFIITILRVIVGSLLTGKLFSPVFIFAIAGGLSSTFAMGMLLSLKDSVFSLIGISIFGAVVKNIVQLGLVYFIFIKQITVFNLIPIFLLSSLITGIIIGFFTHLIDTKVGPAISLQ